MPSTWELNRHLHNFAPKNKHIIYKYNNDSYDNDGDDDSDNDDDNDDDDDDNDDSDDSDNDNDNDNDNNLDGVIMSTK